MDQRTITLLEQTLKTDIETLRRMDIDEEQALIRRLIKKNTRFARDKKGKYLGRGNPLLVEGKITTNEEIDARIKKLYSRSFW